MVKIVFACHEGLLKKLPLFSKGSVLNIRAKKKIRDIN